MDTPFVRAVPPRDPLIGCVLHDRYKVQKRIGKGGMGIVYLAEHVLLRRKVALKTLSERAFASDELVARFHREATAAAALGNEHIVGVTDMGRLDDGSYFIVLEYLDGVELAFAVASHGPMPLARAVHIVSQLCDALHAVHAAGIVHRDLKPENLFLVEREGAGDFLKVLDFGICKVLDEHARGDRPLTHTGASLGTPQFMAPEQIDGSEAADLRADIYAAGAILYFALTGEAPFQSTSLPQLFLRVSLEPPPSLRVRRPELPPALDAVIARALQKRPEDRYQSAAELRAALEPFAGMQIDAAPARGSADTISAIERVVPRRPWRRRGVLISAAAIVIACVWVVLASGVLRGGGEAERARKGVVDGRPARAASSHAVAPATPVVSGVSDERMPSGEPAVNSAALSVSPERARAAARKHTTPVLVQPSPEPTPVPATTAVVPSLAPVAPAAAGPADEAKPAHTDDAYRLSKRGLKDVF